MPLRRSSIAAVSPATPPPTITTVVSSRVACVVIGRTYRREMAVTAANRDNPSGVTSRHPRTRAVRGERMQLPLVDYGGGAAPSRLRGLFALAGSGGAEVDEVAAVGGVVPDAGLVLRVVVEDH